MSAEFDGMWADIMAELPASGSTWLPVDLSDVLDGSWRPPEATVGRRTDGAGLFYPGRLHTVVAETEGGKTWLALAAVLDEMKAGRHVVYIDFEDDQGGIGGRLLTMGAPRAMVRDQFHYFRPEEALKGGHVHALDVFLTDVRPSLVIVDGVTEAMTLHGLDPLKNFDAAQFGAIFTRRLALTGAAVVSLDHVTKDRENRGRYALGAVHKLNGLNGAQYLLENRAPLGVGLTGRSTLKIAKDRPGQLRSRGLSSSGGLYWYGDLVVDSAGEDFAEVTVEPPHERGDDFRPTVLMTRVAAAITQHGELSERKVRTAVGGRAATASAALDYLILDGYVSEQSPHRMIKPYPDETP